jgi:hypothetical protein
MTTKYTKVPSNISNGNKIDQLDINIPASPIARGSRIFV